MRQNMRIGNIIIITYLLLMTFHLNAMSNDTCDFGTISQDTTLMWDGELPMYTPAVKIHFKTTKSMYLTMELNGNIDCVQDMSQKLNFSINSYRVEYLHLPKGNYISIGVVSYNILNKIPYVHAKLTFRVSKPESKPEESVDYSTLPNTYPYMASNHIFVTEPTAAAKEASESTSSSIITKLFYDGFGRLVETVNVAASPNRKHVTTIQGYDYYGRNSESWKPAEDIWDDADEDGYIDPEVVKDAAIMSYNDSCPYTRTVYEHNPLKRTCGTMGIGQKWRKNGKNETTEYLFNNELLRCIRWEEQEGSFKNMGCYKPGEVYVTKDTDEDGNISYIFNNHNGKTILKRKLSKDQSFDTYFIYDDAENLRYILPPAFSEYPATLDETDEDMKDYAYMYHYDTRRRCTEKKLPGCGWVRYIYDRADNAVFTQNGELRKQGKWMFHIYDRLGRVCLEGTCANNLNTQTTPELDIAAEYTGKGTWGYDIQGTNLVGPILLNAYYYDGYDVLGTDLLGNVANYGTKVLFESEEGKFPAKGLLTATLTGVLGADDEDKGKLSAIFIYDEKGRNTYTVANNVMGGIDQLRTTYTFRGKVRERVSRHTLEGKTTLETIRYEYDHVERLKDISYAINNETPIKIASYSYDNVGRLEGKVLGGNIPTKYTYNVKDWMNTISSQHFQQQLFFENGSSVNMIAKDYYNGNISAIKWNTNGKEQTYTFTYDGLDRLLYADHKDMSSNEETYSTEYDYDKNGNVTYLTRMGLVGNTPDIKQELYFLYNGNQLIEVRDDGERTFRKGESTLGGSTSRLMTSGRAYDKNGNVTKEEDKDILSIQYNVINLPSRITFKNGNSIDYLYSGKGEKLRVTYSTTPTMVVARAQAIAINVPIKERIYTYDTLSYCGNIIYRNGSLLRILNETGFATPNKENFALHFFIKDHLGNVRILADSKGNVEQAIDYYPFGSIIAESKDTERQPYLYNGKELDRMNGLDWYDYGARMYESDGLRWGQIDPRAENTPEVSPYVYCNNNPIKASDPNGEKIIIWYKNRRGEDKAFIFTGFHRKNFISCPNNSFVIAFLKSYIYNARHGGGKNTIKAANAPNITVHLEDANTVTDRVDKYHNNGDGDHIVCWDPTTGLKLTNGGRQSAATKLEHEFDHAVDDITNHRAHRNAQKNDGSRYDNPEEKRVIEGSEAQTAKGNGEGVRHNHRGTKYPTISPTSIKEKK